MVATHSAHTRVTGTFARDFLPRAQTPAKVTRALAEIAAAFNHGVNMAAMPQIPNSAPCRAIDADPEDWAEPLRNHEGRVRVKDIAEDTAAEALCAGCPILDDCLNWALANPLQGGVLGGLTHRARLTLLDQPVTRRILSAA